MHRFHVAAIRLSSRNVEIKFFRADSDVRRFIKSDVSATDSVSVIISLRNVGFFKPPDASCLPEKRLFSSVAVNVSKHV